MRTYKDALNEMPEKRRLKIKERTSELIVCAELEKLRKARKMSQKELAEILNISQPAVAKMEQETDMRLSTLRRFAEGLGGSLKIDINFPEGVSHTLLS